MTAVLCLDDAGGMLFNRRRQSQDRVVRERILSLAQGRRLLMNAYSAKQFGGCPGITVCEDYLAQAGPGDVCFIESADVPLERAAEVVLVKWNRRYPGDRFFEADLPAAGFRLASAEEFPGYSHEKITWEHYRRD